MRAALPEWGPARVAEPVQRARNVLAVAAVADVLHLETERWVPLAAFERLEQDFPAEELIQLLFWASTHPDEGDITRRWEVRSVCLETDAPTNTDEGRGELRSTRSSSSVGRPES